MFKWDSLKKLLANPNTWIGKQTFDEIEVNSLLLLDTVWDDERFPFSRDRQGVANKPDYDFTNMGLLFPQNDATEIAYIIAQMSHKYKTGTNIHPHIHYVQDEAQEPVFKMDYRWYDKGTDPTGSFTTITANVFQYTYISGSLFQKLEFPAIDGSGISAVSSFLDIKIYRDDNVVTGDVLVKEFDLHYEIDTIGSASEHVK